MRMLKYELLPDRKVLIVEPQAALEVADFERLVQAVDPFIQRAGGLNGLMIYSDSFPGWNDFHALVSHIRFISNHHQAIRRVAFVTDSAVLTMLPRIASHFVAAEIRRFRHADRDAALDWLAPEPA
jgi:hypothetical protein